MKRSSKNNTLAAIADLQKLQKATRADFQQLRKETKDDFRNMQRRFDAQDKRSDAHDSLFEILLALVKNSIADVRDDMRSMEDRLTQMIYNAVSEHDLVLTDHSKRLWKLEKKAGV